MSKLEQPEEKQAKPENPGDSSASGSDSPTGASSATGKSAALKGRSRAADSELAVNRKGFIETIGEIVELLPGLKFRIALDSGQEIIATMKGRMRMHRIQLVVGDRVKVEMSPYDLTKGRIVYRQ